MTRTLSLDPASLFGVHNQPAPPCRLPVLTAARHFPSCRRSQTQKTGENFPCIHKPPWPLMSVKQFTWRKMWHNKVFVHLFQKVVGCRGKAPVGPPQRAKSSPKQAQVGHFSAGNPCRGAIRRIALYIASLLRILLFSDWFFDRPKPPWIPMAAFNRSQANGCIADCPSHERSAVFREPLRIYELPHKSH